MDNRTGWAYCYPAFGKDHIGCRAKGYGGDCWTDLWDKVDCTTCPYGDRVDWQAKRGKRKRKRK